MNLGLIWDEALTMLVKGLGFSFGFGKIRVPVEKNQAFVKFFL